MQHVPGEVKGQVLLRLVDRLEVALLACRSELVERRVRAGDVGGVVLAGAQFEQPRGVVGLQRGVAVWQFRQRICLHGRHLRSV